MGPMPNWNELISELNAEAKIPSTDKIPTSPFDRIRRKYLSKLRDTTKRNVLAYYSGWLQKSGQPGLPPTSLAINDNDMNGFMACLHRMNKDEGLDLILHTPGGDLAAVEAIITYLKKHFNGNMRAIVPQLAMSGGTMMSLACKEILMGKHSSLGPVDPQFNGIPAQGIIEEFGTALTDVQKNQSAALVWQPIIQKYSPALVGSCQKAIALAETLAIGYLASGMFAGHKDPDSDARKAVQFFNNHGRTLMHARHIDAKEALAQGLKIVALEDDNTLQDIVLTIHHAFCHTFSSTGAVKIIENHMGIAMVDSIQHQVPPKT